MKTRISQNLLFWLCLSITYAIIAYYSNSYILTDTLYYNSLAEQLSVDRIEQLLSSQSKNKWLGYVFLPVFIFLKVFLIAGCIYTGLFLFDVKLRFKQLLQIVYISEFVFVAAGLLRIVLLDFFYTPETLEQLQQFAPLSLYSLFSAKDIPVWLTYPLQLINVFECIYILVLSYLLAKGTEKTMGQGVKYTLSSYGSGLLLWCMIIIFIQLQFS